MRLRIHWTDEAVEHIVPHGLHRAEVDAATQGLVYYRQAHGRLILIGQGNHSLLFVVLVRSRSHPGFVEVVTARRATRAEKRLFRRRAKVRR